MSRPDVIVVGGGVVGCAIAWHLAREGVSVTVFEGGEMAGGASGAAAGMLTPFSENEGPGPALSWGRESLARFPELVVELREASGIDPEYLGSGALRVAATEAEESVLRARIARLPDEGLEWVDGDALSRLEPALRPGLRGALHAPSEAHVRSPRLVRAYAQAAARLGADLRPGVPVVGFLCEGDRVVGVETSAGAEPAGAVVVCTGCFTDALLRRLDPALRAPVEPVRGQIVSVGASQPPFASILWDADAYLVPKRDGSVAIGATSERVGFDRRVTAEAVAGLLAAGARLVPTLGQASFLEAWAGLRPDTPDHLPLVGPVPGVSGLVLAAGHYRTGVLLSPATGRMVADGLAGKGWAEPAFLPERFLGA